jgi:hypothetical protein
VILTRSDARHKGCDAIRAKPQAERLSPQETSADTV